MKKPSVLVTGGCGYIGSHVVRQLSEAGADVVVLDDLRTGFRSALLHGERLYEGDVGDVALLRSIFAKHAVDCVMHFAASTVVPESVANPLKYYTNNTVNTAALVREAERRGVKRFVFSSTAAVYGEPSTPGPIPEATKTEPASPYGRSKLMSEWLLQDVAAASDLRFVILRYFNVAGAHPGGRLGQSTPNATHLIKVACEAAVGKRDSMTIYGTDYPTADGTCIRDYIHVEDLAAAHLKALGYLMEGGPSVTLNCGYGKGYSVRSVLAMVQSVSGVELKVVYGPRRAGDVAAVVAQADEIGPTLGWEPQYDRLQDIVQHAYQWEAQLSRTPRPFQCAVTAVEC